MNETAGSAGSIAAMRGSCASAARTALPIPGHLEDLAASTVRFDCCNCFGC